MTVGLVVFPGALWERRWPDELRPLTDSKLLTAKVRDSLLDAILMHAEFCVAVHASSRLIDTRGLNPATEFAMIRSIERARQQGLLPDRTLIDGYYRLDQVRPRFPEIEFECIVRGDQRVASIAAASIVAKVARDRRMQRYADLFPGYGLERHKGYATEHHRALIQEKGPSPIHRRSFQW